MEKNPQNEVARQKKIILLGSVALLGMMSAAVYVMASKDDTHESSKIHQMGATARPSSDGNTPKHKQTVAHHNNQRAEEATKSGDSFLSLMTPPEPTSKPAPQTPPPPPPKETVVIHKHVAVYDKHHEKLREEKMAMAAALINSWKPQPATKAVMPSTDTTSTMLHHDKAQNQQTNDAMLSNMIVIHDFAKTPAILETALDTDENSVVTAYIPSGPYQGARLYAMGYKLLGNSIDMIFTAMEYRGSSYKVQAKPVDIHTSRTVLSGEVNNRYFSRVFIPALASSIGKVGSLYERGSAENIITEGTVVQTYPETPNTRNVVGTVLGGIGEEAGQVMTQDAARMPIKQVTIPSGTTIGIQFIGGVTEADRLNKNANVDHGLSSASQASNTPKNVQSGHVQQHLLFPQQPSNQSGR